MIKMNEENKMYEYLLEHNYISQNENKNPLRQQELSKERAECIANKYNNLVEELQNNWNELKKWLEEQKEFINDIPIFSNDIKNNHIGMIGAYNNSLDKMQELERCKDE